MPEHIRALVVILALGAVTFLVLRPPVCAAGMSANDFGRRRNVWLALSLIAFLSHNFWIYIVLAGVTLALAASREKNPMALFFFVLFAVPPLSKEIAGVGGIRMFFAIDYIRLLSLTILVPAFLACQRKKETMPFGRTPADKLLAAYLIINFILVLMASTFTGALRHGIFYAFIDVFLPYYVASRSIRSLEDFRDALLGLLTGIVVLGVIALFEFGRHWLLYSTLQDALGVQWGYGHYLARGGDTDDSGMLRAQGSTGQPIALGYVMAVGIGILLYLARFIRPKFFAGLGLILMGAALIASISRGPWIGAAVIIVLYAILSGSPKLRMGTVGLAIVAPVALLISPMAEKLIDYVPFIGTVAEGSITYRQRLLEISVEVIMQRPLFGAFDYVHSPAMQELKQGQGIVDIVNTYLAVGLGSGLVGLSLFVGFFAAIMLRIRTTFMNSANTDVVLLGKALTAILVGILLIIATVSSISVIPVLYWTLAGLGMAYSALVQATPALGHIERRATRASFGLGATRHAAR